MEDNEFEEVTIISHTDHGTSVLPQSTAERLMKEIKLEVTQKISQNENVKLGSLQHSTTPTILDQIQKVLDSSAIKRPTDHGILAYLQPNSEGSLSVMLSHNTAHIFSKDLHNASPITFYQGLIPSHLQHWGGYFFCFFGGVKLKVVEFCGRAVKELLPPTSRVSTVLTTEEHLYFVTKELVLMRVDRNLELS